MTTMIIKRLALAALAAITCGGGARAAEIAVGVELPLSGTLARVGAGLREGITVAAELFNQNGGRHRIKLITVDDESTPAKAITAVEQLAGRGVAAITGGYGSSNVAPAAAAAERLGLVYLTSGGIDDSLVAGGRKTFFRINNTSGYQKAVLGLLQQVGAKSVAIVYSTRKVSAELALAVQKGLAARGVRVALHPFDPAIADFKPMLGKIKRQDKPDVIAMVGYENDYVGILRAARAVKPPVKAMLGVWSLATPKMAAEFPDLMPNVFGTALLPFPAQFKTAEGKAFGAAYQRLYKRDPDYLGLFGYVQSMLLFEALARVADRGAVTRGGVADELRKTDRVTLIGRVRFDANGDNPHFTHRMAQHQGRAIVIVWPPESATGASAYPARPW